MFDELIININNIGPISSANFNLGKNINIIGGENSSGKSTASKILYCFLTANSNERFEIARNSLSLKINNLYNILRR